ncbi:uncharacterized protein LOC122951088 isoform X1 [Acropora millepora]|uniref:uncharacterized protein LOC122951088 isoform X1 n=1 Tax=Acropora millepora TaxID=45264 RepID=UPI001CF38950|nr:uncharacterized protein LOC122951088 isoform X1 [Acropora millepora]
MPSQKRKNTSSSMNSKNKKTCGLEEKRDDEEFTPLEIKIKRLQEKRPMKEDFKIRVWAKMLINGNHKSEDDTPHFPFFTGRKAGVRKRDCAVSASKDVSSAQSTSTVTSNNDKVCFISYTTFTIVTFILFINMNLLQTSRHYFPTDAKTGCHNSAIEGH